MREIGAPASLLTHSSHSCPVCIILYHTHALEYYGTVKEEQWNYHLGKMYIYVDVCKKRGLPTYKVRHTNPGDDIRNQNLLIVWNGSEGGEGKLS